MVDWVGSKSMSSITVGGQRAASAAANATEKIWIGKEIVQVVRQKLSRRLNIRTKNGPVLNELSLDLTGMCSLLNKKRDSKRLTKRLDYE